MAAKSDQDAIILYLWNIRLAEALIPSLAMFEVAFRNSVHRALVNETDSEYWFRDVLQGPMYNNIRDLIERLERRHGHRPTPGKIISEITFGFWPRLFARRYNSLWWRYPDPLIGRVIPHHPALARDTRAKLQQRLEYFATLRNRAMHHEVVFEGIAAINRPVLPLVTLHDHIIETLGWVHPDATEILSPLDRFDHVVRYGRDEIRKTLQSYPGRG